MKSQNTFFSGENIFNIEVKVGVEANKSMGFDANMINVAPTDSSLIDPCFVVFQSRGKDDIGQ